MIPRDERWINVVTDIQYDMHTILSLALHCKSKERAKAEEAGDSVDAGQEGSDNGSDEGLEAAAEQDGLQSEVLRGKNMDVASMDALKKRIEVRCDVHIAMCLFPSNVNVSA